MFRLRIKLKLIYVILTSVVLSLCVFMSGCRFDLFHEIDLEKSGEGLSVLDSTVAQTAAETEIGAIPGNTGQPEEITADNGSQDANGVTFAGDATVSDAMAEVPPQLTKIDIYDRFQIGLGISRTGKFRKTDDESTPLSIKGVDYEYVAGTDYISRNEIGDFFYSGLEAYDDSILVAYVFEYPEIGSDNLLRRKFLLRRGDRYLYRFSEDCEAIRITVAFVQESVKTNRQELTEQILREAFSVSPAEELDLYRQMHADTPEDLRFVFSDAEKNTDPGLANLLARARQFASIQYELHGDLPAQTEEGIIPGTDADGKPMKIIGLPYSSVRSTDKMIGQNVSLYTFLTAVNNPRSVLYTRCMGSPNARTFYGTVCSAFADYANGFPWFLPSQYLNSSRCNATYEKSLDNMEVGDLLISPQHVMLITDIYRDEFGVVHAVTYTHAVYPLVTTAMVTYEDFVALLEKGNYDFYRYKGVSRVPYEPSPYVVAKEGEAVEPIDYPDIMCEFGDKAVLMGGNGSAAAFEREVTINVLNKEDYYAIQVYRDSVHPIDYERSDRDYELLETRSTVKDFVMGDPENGLIPGAYKVVMRGVDRKTSTTEFFVVDASCLYENDRIYWRCGNAEAAMVYIYTDSPSNEPIILTRSNVMPSDLAGYDYYVDLSAKRAEMALYNDKVYKNVKINFGTRYGTATWYSYFQQNWVRRVDG